MNLFRAIRPKVFIIWLIAMAVGYLILAALREMNK